MRNCYQPPRLHAKHNAFHDSVPVQTIEGLFCTSLECLLGYIHEDIKFQTALPARVIAMGCQTSFKVCSVLLSNSREVMHGLLLCRRQIHQCLRWRFCKPKCSSWWQPTLPSCQLVQTTLYKSFRVLGYWLSTDAVMGHAHCKVKNTICLLACVWQQRFRDLWAGFCFLLLLLRNQPLITVFLNLSLLVFLNV